MTKQNAPIWWAVAPFILFFHTVAILSLAYYTPHARTLQMVFWIFVFGGLGITMGYHRLWSHNTYKAVFPLRLLLALCGTLALQGM
jgi:stearoyl-CoA desaturase (delta-9 desaturase)